MKNLFSKTSASRFFSSIFDLGSMVHLESGRKSLKDIRTLSAMILHIGFVMIPMCFTGKLKFQSRYRQLIAFVGYLYVLRRRHGSKYTVMYLKSGLQALEKAVAGSPVQSLQEFNTGFNLPRTARSGLPAYIPLRDRRLILANHSEAVTRWWFTLFALFRVISIPGELKLSTITKPLSVPRHQVSGIADQLYKIVNPSMFDIEMLATEPSPEFLESASSTFKVSWLGFTYDAALIKFAGLESHLISFCNLLGYSNWIGRYHNIINGFESAHNVPDVYQNPIVGDSLVHDTSKMLREVDNFNSNTTNLEAEELLSTKGLIGKLSIKEEPAGKRRVFAMVDSWTQSLLTPLHNMCTKFLKSLPNDGLFNQYASVRRAQQKALIAGKSFGFDLSAATDRVPLILQIEILNLLVPHLGEVWSKLLDRPFSLSERTIIKTGRRTRLKVDSTHIVRYAVGQPMGARSSFPMLSVVHHHLVQLAAHNAYPIIKTHVNWLPTNEFPNVLHGYKSVPTLWYTGYELNGDDLVIFDKAVADQYLILMKDIGCEINLTKSIIANNSTFEYLKVIGHNGWDISPLPWKALLSQPTLMGRVQLCDALLSRDIVRKGHKLSFITNMVRKAMFMKGTEYGTAILALATMQSGKGFLDILSIYTHLLHGSKNKRDVFSAMKTKTISSVLQNKVVESYNKMDKVIIPPVKEYQPDP